MIISIIILSILLIVASYIAYNQILRCRKLEDISNIIVKNMKEISDIISDTQKSLDNPRLTEAFSSDDEVGIFFNQIKDIQCILNQFIVVDNGKENI